MLIEFDMSAPDVPCDNTRTERNGRPVGIMPPAWQVLQTPALRLLTLDEAVATEQRFLAVRSYPFCR